MVGSVGNSSSNKSSSSSVSGNQKTGDSASSQTKSEVKSDIKNEAQGTAGTKDVAPGADKLKEARLETLTDAQDAARNNKSLRPHGGKTYCNLGVEQTLKGVGIDVEDKRVGITDPETGHPYTANTIAKNLSDSAKEENGYWRQIDSKKAQELANEGLPVVGAQKRSPHGHVATVRPEGQDKGVSHDEGGVLINNIGTKNKVQGDNWSFVKDVPVNYYVSRSDSQGY